MLASSTGITSTMGAKITNSWNQTEQNSACSFDFSYIFYIFRIIHHFSFTPKATLSHPPPNHIISSGSLAWATSGVANTAPAAASAAASGWETWLSRWKAQKICSSLGQKVEGPYFFVVKWPRGSKATSGRSLPLFRSLIRRSFWMFTGVYQGLDPLSISSEL